MSEGTKIVNVVRVEYTTPSGRHVDYVEPHEIPNFPEFDTVSEGYWDFPEWMKRLVRRFTRKPKGER